MAVIIATLDHERRNTVTRQALRTAYPFHQHNPRSTVACCARKPLPRRSWLQRVRDEFARLLR
jgi:hypothetical protein